MNLLGNGTLFIQILSQVWDYTDTKIILGHFFPVVLTKLFLGGTGPGTVSTRKVLKASLHLTDGERTAQRH